MPQYSAPQNYPDWAEGQGALIAQPTPSQQASGFTLNQRPSANNMNWLFQTIGRTLRWLSQGVNSVLVGSFQEPDFRLIGGGTYSWTASPGTLAWSDTFYISCPGLADTANACAAGNVTLTSGQVAYVLANVPFGTKGDLTAGSNQVANLAFESGIAVGMTASGAGLPSGTTVAAISQSDSSLTLSAAATATGSGVQLTFASSGPLTVQAVDVASFAPSANTIVIARCIAGIPNQVHIGVNSGQMRVLDGESKRLLGNGFVSTQQIAAGTGMQAGTWAYVSQGATDTVTLFRSANALATYQLSLDGPANFPAPVIVSAGDKASGSGVTSGTIVSSVDPSSGAVSFSPSLQAADAGGNPANTIQITFTRTAGLAYPATASQYTTPQRAQVIGFVASDVAKGATAHIVTSGNATTLQNLVPGATYFLDANSQGRSTLTAPNTIGQSVTPIGKSLTSSSLSINAAAASQASVVASAVYKSTVDMGYFYDTNTATTALYPTRRAVVSTTGASQFVPHVMPATHPGSVVGISVHLNNSIQANTTVYLGKALGTFVSVPIAGNGVTDGYVAFAKGTYPFAAGDTLKAYVSFSQTGVNVALEVFITVELTP